MKNRNLFLFLVIVFVIAPAIHYFIAGENFDNSVIRNVLVGIQALVGIVLLVVYGRKPKHQDTSK